MSETRKLAAILVADVVGYSRLAGADEDRILARLRALRSDLIDPTIALHRGRIVKRTGDGSLIEFRSVVDAVRCAVEVQNGMLERNAGLPPDRRIEFRIGIHLGDVVEESDGDLMGDGVNIAARLEGIAQPGAICLSEDAYRQVSGRLDMTVADLGPTQLKNIERPVRVYSLEVGQPALAKAKPLKVALTAWARPIAAVMVLLAVLAAAGWYGIVRSSTHTVAATHFPAIAVLPFDDLSPDKSIGYLGDGVSEDIITMLSRFPDLSVIARNSSFVYKGKPIDIRQVGRDLNVDYALEGSVRKETDQIRITAQLIDTQTGKHVWAERYDKAGKDPLALQDEVTGKIVGAMTGEKGQVKQGQYHEAWGRDAANLGEYDYYLRGHDIFMNANSREDNDRAGRIWEEGLAKYPDSNLLKVKLGWYHMKAGWRWWSDDVPAEFRRAGELSRAVLAANNLSPQVKRLAHWLFAQVLTTEGDFDRAATEADAAIALAPYDSSLIADLSSVLIACGKPDKALEWIDAATIRDPGSARDMNYNRGLALRILGNYEDSIAAFKQANYPDADTRIHLAIALVRLGRIDEARAEVRAYLGKNDPKFTGAAWRTAWFYSDPAIVDREVADLATAGLPEK